MGKANRNMYKLDFTNYLFVVLEKIDNILDYIE
jgi:hypothetical protein